MQVVYESIAKNLSVTDCHMSAQALEGLCEPSALRSHHE